MYAQVKSLGIHRIEKCFFTGFFKKSSLKVMQNTRTRRI